MANSKLIAGTRVIVNQRADVRVGTLPKVLLQGTEARLAHEAKLPSQDQGLLIEVVVEGDHVLVPATHLDPVEG